jgi:hypothetical protein
LNEEVIAWAVFLGLLFFAAHLVWRLLPKRPEPRLDPDKYIVVDGSNVMHWGGEASVLVLKRVLQALDEKGLIPIVYFDANVGYKLWDRYAGAGTIAGKIGMDSARIFVVAKGVVADEVLLEAAVDNGLRVVTNDRFLDWRVQFPRAGDKGFLVKGEWRQGNVMFRGL